MGGRARRFWQLPRRHKRWLLELVLLSALAKIAIAFIPLRCLVRYLGQPHHNRLLSVPVSPDQQQQAREIGRLTAGMARITPWQSQCLVQVLAAKTLLARQHIPWVVHFGARHGQQGDLNAHAWLSVGPDIIVGRRGHRTFGIVATYASVAATGKAF